MSTIAQFGGGGVKSIQRGVIAIASLSTSATATISSVNTAKSELRFLGSRGADNSGASGGALCTVVLTNGTTITATRDVAATHTCSASWELTEFY